MKCSVFIATSADGYIATESGGVDWLEMAGDSSADMSEHGDMGFSDYIVDVDCMIIGRKCMEKLASFNLTEEQWPYGKRRVIALSNTLTNPCANLPDTVEMYSGDIMALTAELKNQGYKHAYIDGGTTITAFINLKLINKMTITQAPVLLGSGLPLFGFLNNEITLEAAKALVYPNNFIQTQYVLSYK